MERLEQQVIWRSLQAQRHTIGRPQAQVSVGAIQTTP